MDKSELGVFMGTLEDWPHAEPDEDWLRDNWKLKRTKSGSTGKIFISPCGKYICKLGYFISQMPPCAIPTKFLEAENEDCWGGTYTYVIQPLANIRNRGGVLAKIREIMSNRDGHDIHIGNVATYDHKPVLIDW